MIIAASSLSEEALPHFDVAIVGAGAVGVALATRLANGLGPIALIEAGGARPEPHAQTQFFEEDHAAPGHPSTALYRRRVLGGTTSVWGGRCIALDREDVEAPTHSSGWPISYREVISRTADALQFLQAGSDVFSADVLPLSAKSDSVDGIHDPDLQLDRIERFSEPTNVWERWGPQLANSKHVFVLHGATCTNIRTNRDATQAVGLDLRTRSGNLSISAAKIVLACGGLETPRLLLVSRNHLSCGLGNEHDLVGRYYTTHLAGTLGSLKFSNSESDRCFDYGLTADGTYVRRLIVLSPETRRRQNIGNIIFRPSIHSVADPSHTDSILSAAALTKKFLTPEYSKQLVFGARESMARDLLSHASNIVTGIPRLARFGFSWLRRRTLARRKLPSLFLLRSDRTYPIAYDAEQTPDFANRIALGASRDPYGIPRLSVNWRIAEDDIASITRAYRVLASAIGRTGLGDVKLEPDFVDELRDSMGPVGGHHIGTARMGTHQRTSVVDDNCELWGTKGVFVAGTSLFPTCGSANPTLTAVALAFRLADRLIDDRKKS